MKFDPFAISCGSTEPGMTGLLLNQMNQQNRQQANGSAPPPATTSTQPPAKP